MLKTVGITICLILLILQYIGYTYFSPNVLNSHNFYNKIVYGLSKYLNNENKILIYGATNVFGSPWDENAIEQHCGEEISRYCSITTDVSRSASANAWLYHNRDFSPRLMENWTNSQVHVMFTRESPTYEEILYKPNKINWTMTYKRDSDIFWPWGLFEKKNNANTTNLDAIWDKKDKNLRAAWMVSNCKAKNGRMQLAKQIQAEGLKLDIYGLCGKIKMEPRGLMRKYYFYFSFENSNCVDYVTEKFYNALILFHAIPIVIKREIYTNLGIPANSFIAVDDFESTNELVGFLEDLKGNKTKYLSYHQWRNEWKVKRFEFNKSICALCQKLKEPLRVKKSYSNLTDWFEKDACDNLYTFNYP